MTVRRMDLETKRDQMMVETEEKEVKEVSRRLESCEDWWRSRHHDLCLMHLCLLLLQGSKLLLPLLLPPHLLLLLPPSHLLLDLLPLLSLPHLLSSLSACLRSDPAPLASLQLTLFLLCLLPCLISLYILLPALQHHDKVSQGLLLGLPLPLHMAGLLLLTLLLHLLQLLVTTKLRSSWGKGKEKVE